MNPLEKHFGFWILDFGLGRPPASSTYHSALFLCRVLASLGTPREATVARLNPKSKAPYPLKRGTQHPAAGKAQ
jgi:hypothetical protein